MQMFYEDEQVLDLHREEMPCQYRLLYDLFMNTGLRLKEVYLLEEDCIEESRYPNVCQLKYIPHKTLSARHRRGAGDYHRIMIPKDIAGRLSQHIIEDAEERKIAGTSYIFRSRRYGYERAVIDSQPFVADTEQTEYYREQIALWREKQVRFSAFPIICENAKRNAGLFESILKSIETDVQRNEANNT